MTIYVYVHIKFGSVCVYTHKLFTLIFVFVFLKDFWNLRPLL